MRPLPEKVSAKSRQAVGRGGGDRAGAIHAGAEVRVAVACLAQPLAHQQVGLDVDTRGIVQLALEEDDLAEAFGVLIGDSPSA